MPFSGGKKRARGPLLREGWLEVPVLWAQRSRQRPHDPLMASLQTHVLPSPSQLLFVWRNISALIYPNLLFNIGWKRFSFLSFQDFPFGWLKIDLWPRYEFVISGPARMDKSGLRETNGSLRCGWKRFIFLTHLQMHKSLFFGVFFVEYCGKLGKTLKSADISLISSGNLTQKFIYIQKNSVLAYVCLCLRLNPYISAWF